MVKKEKKVPPAQTASWLDIVWRAVHQLSVINNGQEYFHYYQDICRFVETFWVRLADGKERTPTWTNTVSSTITTHKRVFKPGPDQGFWGLRVHPVDNTSETEYNEIREIWAPIAATIVIETPISKVMPSYIASTAPAAPVSVAPAAAAAVAAPVSPPAPLAPVTQSLPSSSDTLLALALRRKRKTGWGDKKSKKLRFAVKKTSKVFPQISQLPLVPLLPPPLPQTLEFEESSSESELEPSGIAKLDTVMMGDMNVLLSNKRQRKGDEDEDQYVDIMTVSESDSLSSPHSNGNSDGGDCFASFDPSFDFRFETRSFFVGDEFLY